MELEREGVYMEGRVKGKVYICREKKVDKKGDQRGTWHWKDWLGYKDFPNLFNYDLITILIQVSENIYNPEK